MLTLTIIGAGRLGRTIGKLFVKHKIFNVNSVYNRTLIKAQESVEFIGAGSAVADFNSLLAADLYLISVADAQLATIGRQLHSLAIVKPGSVVFHCSGATSSSIFKQFNGDACYVASVHPMKSFADPSIAVTSFVGTYCGIEGDSQATSLLGEAFAGIGGKMFTIRADKKAMYHAAAIMACNNLVALLECAATMLMDAGLDREMAFNVMEPIVTETVTNVYQLGTTKALTGPLVRGDVQTINGHLNAIGEDIAAKQLYALLGNKLLALAHQQRTDLDAEYAQIKQIFADIQP